MAYNFAALTKPVSPDEPCGPDLDLAGDPDFANFVARAEGLFPASFFTRDGEGVLQAFDRSTIDFPPEFKALDGFLDTTRDLRLLVIYGRLLALNRDIAGFAACIAGVAGLVQERWDEVYPRGEDGDFTFRGAILQGFDDNPTVIQPLQHAPLVQSRRAGPISYRTVMVATGEAAAREGEPVLDRAGIDRAFGEAELSDVKDLSDRLGTIADATGVIQSVTVEKAGHEQAANLDKLPTLVGKMKAFVDSVIAARDPTAPQALAAAEAAAGPDGASAAPAAAAASVPRGRIATMPDATEALAAVSRYFTRHEPSNPAALLVQQAQALIGKSFVDVVRTLLPSSADNAKISLGTDKLFGLTFYQLDSLVGTETDTSYEATADEEPAADSVEDSGSTANGEDAAADAEGGAPDGEAPAAPAPKTPIVAATRADASALLDQIGLFFRSAEPSSPIPLLTDRARTMIERDFLTLLKDVLPELADRSP